jgi:mono/diheme cytochrome c family protein
MRRFLIALGLLVVLLIAAVGYILSRGVSAREPPNALEAAVARRLRHLAIPRGARETPNPLPLTPGIQADGLAHFADHCAICHANDGSGTTTLGKSTYPQAPDMRLPDTQRLSDGELFYIIENGIRFTAMPGWGTPSPQDDEATWGLVHFIRRLPNLTADELARMRALNPKTAEEWQADQFLAGGDAPAGEPTHDH